MASNAYTNNGEGYVIDALDAALGTGAAVQSGTGTVAAAKADTALGTAIGSRVASTTKSQPTADVLRIVKTIAYTATYAVTEVGLFADATTGVLIQRHVFDPVNVNDGDSIEFTIEHEQAGAVT